MKHDVQRVICHVGILKVKTKDVYRRLLNMNFFAGSEYDSDENLDLDEEEDVLELEEGDKDQVGTEEELRDQVGRAHL